MPFNELFLVRKNSSVILGPYTNHEVIQQIILGELSANDEICKSLGYWCLIADAEEIQNLLEFILYKPRVQSVKTDDLTSQLEVSSNVLPLSKPVLSPKMLSLILVVLAFSIFIGSLWFFEIKVDGLISSE